MRVSSSACAALNWEISSAESKPASSDAERDCSSEESNLTMQQSCVVTFTKTFDKKDADKSTGKVLWMM